MRFANLDGRAAIITSEGAADIHESSEGKFGPEPEACFAAWEPLRAWASTATLRSRPFDETQLEAPSPTPRQVFGIGLNYAGHAAESGIPEPDFPPTFTKFASCITGPDVTVQLPSAAVDWEVELVVVIGVEAHCVAPEDAWSHIAGACVGQDLSEREVQLRPPVPQFSLGKSFPGFGPTGPWLVTPDDLANADDLPLSCAVNGEVVQSSTTGDLIFSVPQLVEKLSAITPLLPGDLIFTGTPAGVGQGRTPPRFLADGDELVSTIEGIGTITARFVASAVS